MSKTERTTAQKIAELEALIRPRENEPISQREENQKVHIWFLDPENNFTEEELGSIRNARLRNLVIPHWMGKVENNPNFENFEELVRPLDPISKLACFSTLARKKTNDQNKNNQISFVKFKAFITPLLLIDLINYTNNTIADWSKKNPHYELNELSELLPFIFPTERPVFVREWYENNGEKITDLKKLETLWELMEYTDPVIMEEWYEAHDDQITQETIAALKPSIFKDLMRAEWISINEVGIEYIENFLNAGEEIRDSLSSWLDLERNNVDANKLKEILKKIDDAVTANDIFDHWIIKDGNNFDFKDFMDLARPLKNRGENEMLERNIRLWINKNEVNLGQYKELISLIDGDEKTFLVLLDEMIKKFSIAADMRNKTFEEKLSKLRQLFDEGLINLYDTQSIAVFCQSANFSPADIVRLGNELYPVLEITRIMLFLDTITTMDYQVADDFLKSIKETNNAAIFVIKLEERRELSSQEILQICTNKTNSQYFYIEPLLEGKTISGALTDAGIEELTSLLGTDIVSHSLKGVFTYLNFTNIKMAERLLSFIRPEIIEQIQNQHKLQEPRIYLTIDEQLYLQSLGVIKSKDAFPVIHICQYLIEQIPPTVELTEKVIANYQIFKNDPTAEQSALNTQFRDLLKRDLDYTSAQLVTDFLIKVTGRSVDEGANISDTHKKHFLDLFKRKKPEIAALFAADGGLERFSTALYSSGDGCIVNLSAQFERAYLMSILPNPADRFLYSFFLQNISGPILHSGDDYLLHLGEGSDLTNTAVVKHAFRPLQLFEKLKESAIAMAYKDEVKQPVAAGTRIDDSEHLKMDDGTKFVAEIIGHEIRKFCDIDTIVAAKVDKTLEDHELTGKIVAYLAVRAIQIQTASAEEARGPNMFNLFDSLHSKTFSTAKVACKIHINKTNFSFQALANFIRENPPLAWQIIREEIKIAYGQNSAEEMIKSLKSESPKLGLKTEDLAIYLILDARDFEIDKFAQSGLENKVESIRSLLSTTHDEVKSKAVGSQKSPSGSTGALYSGKVGSGAKCGERTVM